MNAGVFKVALEVFNTMEVINQKVPWVNVYKISGLN